MKISLRNLSLRRMESADASPIRLGTAQALWALPKIVACALCGSSLRPYTPLCGSLHPREGRSTASRAIGGFGPRCPRKGSCVRSARVSPRTSAPVLLDSFPATCAPGTRFRPQCEHWGRKQYLQSGSRPKTAGFQASEVPLRPFPTQMKDASADFICRDEKMRSRFPSLER